MARRSGRAALVANTEGGTIGDVRRVVQGQDGRQTLLVIGIGGFLGIGERALPLEAFQAGVRQLTLAGYARAALENRLPYDEARYRAVSPAVVLKAPPD